MTPKNLTNLYRERAQSLGIAKPKIPRTKERLIQVIKAADMLGTASVNPKDPIRIMVIQMFRDTTPEKQSRLKQY